MQINNRILDDLTRVTNSALGTMTGVKGEVDAAKITDLEKRLAVADAPKKPAAKRTSAKTTAKKDV